MDFLKVFDGSDRNPRDIQVETLKWVKANWDSPGLVVQAGTGTGKSAIARAIQLQTGASILTPNNALLMQYGESYPNLNTLMGAEHYKCSVGGDHDDCTDCEYAIARSRAQVEPTVFNPLSYIFSKARTKIVIIDEAHKLLDFLRLVVSYKFSKARYNPPKEPDFAWIRSKADAYFRTASVYKERKELKKAAANFQKAKTLSGIADHLEQSPNDFVCYFDNGDWVVEPIEVPRAIIEKALGKAEKVILLSATIPPKWAKQILGHRSFKYLDLPSPIPAENRRVIATSSGLTAKSSPADVSMWIKNQLTRYSGNAIVHVTYSMGLALAPYFPNALVHTKQTKQSTLSKFKRQGGLWIAAGAAEGIDLPHDEARLNLVPVLPFANNQGPLGAEQFKRDSYQYYLETAVQFVQQAGRTTRGVDDWSVTVCGDSRLLWLLKKCDGDLPCSFKKALKWS